MMYDYWLLDFSSCFQTKLRTLTAKARSGAAAAAVARKVAARRSWLSFSQS